MRNLKNNVVKLLLWISGYVNIIVYALVGGYVLLKCDNEELDKENKKVFLVTAICIAISAFFSIFSACFNFENSYNSDARKVYNIMTGIYTIARIITYTVFGIIAFVKTDTVNNKEQVSTTTETVE